MKRILATILASLLATNTFWTTLGCGGGSKSISDLTPESDIGPQKGVIHYINDHLGNAHLITDSQGNVLREESRYPYGLDWRVDGGDVTTADYVYTGKEYDEETGLVYFGGRYYSPEMGRWITPDPLFLRDPTIAAKRPLENNLYSYVTGNPVNFTDPNGEWVIFALFAVAAATMLASDAPGGAISSTNANLATAIMPVLNDFRDLYEMIAGKDLITKAKLSFEDRVKCSYGLVLGSGALFRQVPQYRVNDFEGRMQFNVTWAGDKKAGIIFEPIFEKERFGLDITGFHRGDFARGSEGIMLADTINYGLPMKPDFLKFQNVLSSDLPFDDLMKTTAQELGGELGNLRMESRLDRGVTKFDITGDINYRLIK